LVQLDDDLTLEDLDEAVRDLHAKRAAKKKNARKSAPKVGGSGTTHGPPHRVDPRWTREDLEAGVDALIAADGSVSLSSLAHVIRRGHPFDDDGYGECEQCGKRERRGASLAGTLAATVACAAPDSKWAGVIFYPAEDGWEARFDEERASLWTAEQARRLAGVTTHAEHERRRRATWVPAELIWPEEKIRRLRQNADRYQRDGDLALASEILYGVIPTVEKQRIAEILEECGTRLVVRDGRGQVWVAAPLEAFNLPEDPDPDPSPVGSRPGTDMGS
jgi:hypothetical protein